MKMKWIAVSLALLSILFLGLSASAETTGAPSPMGKLIDALKDASEDQIHMGA